MPERSRRFGNWRNPGQLFPLFQKYEENCQDQADKGRQMVPLDGLPLEHEHHYDGEDSERDNFLYHLELQQVERSAVACVADAVGRHGEAVFKECNTPREEDDQNEWPPGGDLHFAEFQMPVPGEGHKDVGQNQHHNSPNSLHFF